MGANSVLSAEDMARARAAGLNPDRVTGFLERVRREVDEGLLPAVQVAVARNGQVALSATFGDAGADSMISVFSATKAVISSAAWLLMDDGLLDEGERVADIIPEFASNGKDAVIVQQLFTHTAGFPHAPFRPLEWPDRDRRLQRFAQWRLMWEPGSRFEYHPTATMWVVAEIIERRSGMDFRDFIRRRVVEPLGLKDFYVGLPEHENHRVVPCAHVGEPATPEDYAKLGIPQPPQTEVTEEAVLNFNRPEFRAVGVPGGGGIMSAAALALFYQGLLHGGLGGATVWPPALLASARRVRSGDLRDPVFGMLANRALGLIIAGGEDRHLRGFGRPNSPESFGHNGAGGQLAWVDPASGLSLGYVTSGHDRNPIRQARRGVAISSLAAELCEPA
ncbi:MAG: serine hydrolase domain-containing protein [Gammaproteobacteria bacterium]|nr:serine hydrolase domain-containing protein [Gammaproteobacteria bacterium]